MPVTASGLREECDECERETPHESTVEIRTESPEKDTAAFSKEPYRVSECQVCGTETERRMNGA